MRTTSAGVSLLAALTCVALSGAGQQVAVPFSLLAPEVSADRRVTFRISAPDAKSITVTIDDLILIDGKPVRQFALSKNSTGHWTTTIGPLPPEVYVYNFHIDGAQVFDVRYPDRVTVGKVSNVVEVPASPPRFDQEQSVPHGTVSELQYRSTVQDAYRKMVVYLPAEYATNRAARYPVLYLYHGGSGLEGDWTRYGKAAVILDNLIAQKRALPMIVVSPNGQLEKPGAVLLDVIARELLTDIVPAVERQHRVDTRPEKRALAGLSGGGGTALVVGLANTDKFASIGEFSAGLFGSSTAPGTNAVPLETLVPTFKTDAVTMVRQLKLLYMSCGTDDPRLRYHQETVATLKAIGFAPVFAEFAGAHQWKVFRRSLADFAPRLFR